jgi:Asp-tRNA(Asn)/Glu-tRNA(Gln) amidotransferase A subunit family amidase
MAEIFELGVTELAAAIKDGTLTPTEIAETLLARIEQYDDQVKAFSHLDREAVLAEAKVLTEEAAAGKLRVRCTGCRSGSRSSSCSRASRPWGSGRTPRPRWPPTPQPS